MRKTFQKNEGIEIEGNRLAYFAYADDICLLSSSEKELKQMTTALKEATSKFGLLINEAKTEYLIMTHGQTAGHLKLLHVGDMFYKRVSALKYPGALFTDNSSCEAEINARIQAENPTTP